MEQSTIYGSDTVVTQVFTPAVHFLGSQVGFYPLQNVKAQKLYRHNLGSVYVACTYFNSRPQNNLHLWFVKTALNFTAVLYEKFLLLLYIQ